MIRIEYIWVDGTEPDARLRGKTKFSLSKKEMEKRTGLAGNRLWISDSFVGTDDYVAF